tara:strand:- start:370 stop:765 length:396 start_codon:yes stop_codon:yes gene_type:complete
MIKFFLKKKILFYFINFLVIFLYVFPGSILGLIVYNDISLQPQVTPNLVISSNHFFVFLFLTLVGLLSYLDTKDRKKLIIYLIFLSIILEIFHLVIPERSFQWSDLFGNLIGVLVVIFLNNLINKYGFFKK